MILGEIGLFDTVEFGETQTAIQVNKCSVIFNAKHENTRLQLNLCEWGMSKAFGWE